jgi:hypothetical protein
VKLINLQIQETSSAEFRNYLLSKQDNISWFYWHLNSNLKDFKTYKLIHKSNFIGVFCVQKNKFPIADLYIDKIYRRMGYGKFIVKYITTLFKNIQFKVNTFNCNSISFFEFLLEQKIVSYKVIHKDIKTNTIYVKP